MICMYHYAWLVFPKNDKFGQSTLSVVFWPNAKEESWVRFLECVEEKTERQNRDQNSMSCCPKC
jgi:hypothetical protein